MGMQIVSGGIAGYGAIVNEDGQLLVDAVNSPFLAQAAQKGDAFYIVSGFIALTTTGAFNGILYFINASQSKPLRIARIRTCGTQVAKWQMRRNPSTGTLISSGTEIDPKNMHFGSGLTFSGTTLYGADGSTITDGDILTQWINNAGHSEHDLGGAIRLDNGSSLALECKPSVAGDFCVSIMAFYGE